MTTDDLLARLKGRGLTVILGADGSPALKGATDQITPALRAVLKWHRAAILARLGKPETRQERYRREAGPPLDWTEFRKRLEDFWHREQWKPVGGWKDGERDRRSA